MLAPTALEVEEAKRIKQEEMIHEYNLWDDLAKSNEILVKLADSAKVVDALKDLKYKVISGVYCCHGVQVKENLFYYTLNSHLYGMPLILLAGSTDCMRNYQIWPLPAFDP